jgi:hypothetical protein
MGRPSQLVGQTLHRTKITVPLACHWRAINPGHRRYVTVTRDRAEPVILQ